MKWDGHPSDVLAATVAEMDFPVAAPITAALRAAIDRHDLGYAQAHIPRLAEALSGFAARRLRWRVDPEQVRLLPDVMVGVLELARLLAGENRAVAFATPAYRPFLADLPPSGLVVQEIPHPCSPGSARRHTRAVARAVGCGPVVRICPDLGVEGVQPGGTEGCATGHCFAAHPSGSGPAACAGRARRPVGCPRLRGGLLRRRRLARRRPGPARREPDTAGQAAGRAATRGEVDASASQLSRLVGLSSARPRRRRAAFLDRVASHLHPASTTARDPAQATSGSISAPAPNWSATWSNA